MPPLFDHLVDDTSLLAPRGEVPEVAAVVTRYLATREGRHGGLLGQLVCPVSRLPALVKELARSGPARPVDVSLVVDTGLGAVPKALSTVFSRSNLLTPRTIETAAPVDVDAIWLERVAEFVPDDVVAVVEPRRPMGPEEDDLAHWLDAVRRVAKHGCTPKLRCGGSRSSDVPSVADVDRFVRVVAEAGRGFVALGALPVVGAVTPDGGLAPRRAEPARRGRPRAGARCRRRGAGQHGRPGARPTRPAHCRRARSGRSARCCPAAARVPPRCPPRSCRTCTCSADAAAV